MWIRVYLNLKMNFNSKNDKKKFFLSNWSIKTIYPNEENVFMAPNREKNGDYYVNPCLSQLKNELRFKKW